MSASQNTESHKSRKNKSRNDKESWAEGWGIMYSQYNAKTDQFRVTINFTPAFWSHFNIWFDIMDIIGTTKYTWGSFRATGEEQYNQMKKEMERKFARDMKRMRANYKKWEYTPIICNKRVIHGYHFWPYNEEARNFYIDSEECALCGKDDVQSKATNAWRRFSMDHSGKQNRKAKWIRNNLVPPNGHKEWTPKLIIKQFKAIELEEQQNDENEIVSD